MARPWTAACAGTRPLFDYQPGYPAEPNDTDSAPFMPRSVVINPYFDWTGDRQPRTPYHQTVIYEAHVRGLTMRHPQVPAELRGTYSGLASPRDHRPSHQARRHRDRAHAGPSVGA